MRSVFRLTAAAWVTVAALCLSACVTTGGHVPNPVGAAHHPETIVLALYGTTTIALEGVANTVENPATPPGVKHVLIDAAERVSPILDSGKDLGVEAGKIREEVEAGEASQQSALDVVLAKLDQWLADALPKIQAFTDAVTGAKAP